MKKSSSANVCPPFEADMHTALDSIIAAYDREIAELTHDLCAATRFQDDRETNVRVHANAPAKHPRLAASTLRAPHPDIGPHDA